MSAYKAAIVVAATIFMAAALQVVIGPVLHTFGDGMLGDSPDQYNIEQNGETVVDLSSTWAGWETTVIVGMPTIMMAGSVIYGLVYLFRKQKATGRL